MTLSLFIQAIGKFSAGLLLVGVLLFGSAGTYDYPCAWRLMVLLFVPMFLAGLIMMAKAPDLLRKRLNMKEKLGEQAQVILLSCAMFILGFALAGLGRRLGWPMLPEWLSWTASALFLLPYGLYALVLRENAFLSRTIEIQKNQHVVDTGLYAVVRHPMYIASILLFLSMPLILRSAAALAVFLVYPALIIMRIRSAEAFLRENLEGYEAYICKVRWRLIPFIW